MTTQQKKPSQKKAAKDSGFSSSQENTVKRKPRSKPHLRRRGNTTQCLTPGDIQQSTRHK